MRTELVNPFLTAAFSVFETIFGETPTKGTLQVESRGQTGQQVNVIIGVTGDVSGHVIFGMTLQVADRIASAMIGQPVRTFDALAASAIGELANMVSGNALMHFSDMGFVCDVTPPTVIRGREVEISTLTIPALVVPLILELGEVSLTMGLVQAK